MKYVIREGFPRGDYDASSKARNDVDTILISCGYQPMFVETRYGVQKQKWKKPLQLLIYEDNFRIWKSAINKLKAGDEIVIQYPLLNTTYNFEQVLQACEKKGICTIAMIHDMDSLRFTEELDGARVVNRVHKEDTTFLPAFSRIICHNESMKQALIRYGVSAEKVTCLEIFDYLVSFEPKQHSVGEPVIIAGNLNKNKAQYLRFLDEIEYDFNLYGVNYEDTGAANIHYQGAFKPEELLNHLEGSFGLVWDGKSKQGCSGGWGDYLKYNNPHKASLYLAAGIPVILWKDAALASFIRKYQVGILISDLSEIESLKNIPEEQYEEFRSNCRDLSEKIRIGYFLKQALGRLSD